jgi:hypothetical protein
MISPGKRSFESSPATPSGLGVLKTVMVATNLDETVTAFLLDRRIAGATTTTTATYRIQLQAFINWCRQNAPVAHSSAAVMGRYSELRELFPSQTPGRTGCSRWRKLETLSCIP